MKNNGGLIQYIKNLFLPEHSVRIHNFLLPKNWPIREFRTDQKSIRFKLAKFRQIYVQLSFWGRWACRNHYKKRSVQNKKWINAVKFTLWQTNMAMESSLVCRKFIFKWSMFHCYVSVTECKNVVCTTIPEITGNHFFLLWMIKNILSHVYCYDGFTPIWISDCKTHHYVHVIALEQNRKQHPKRKTTTVVEK